RQTQPVFIGAGGFADQHDLGGRVAIREHQVGGGAAQGDAVESHQGSPQGRQVRCRFGGFTRRLDGRLLPSRAATGGWPRSAAEFSWPVGQLRRGGCWRRGDGFRFGGRRRGGGGRPKAALRRRLNSLVGAPLDIERQQCQCLLRVKLIGGGGL